MVASLGVILLVFGLVCSILAALVFPPAPPVPAWVRLHLGWLSIAFLFAALIFGGLKL